MPLHNWMEELYNDPNSAFKTKKIYQIVIPGTHDSGCANINYTPWAQTQERTILQQLQNGIRYLDLRFAPGGGSNGGGFRVVHPFNNSGFIDGKERSTTFNDVVDDVNSFIAQNPKEIVILHITHFTSFDNDDYTRFFSQLISRLPIIPKSNSDDTINTILSSPARNVIVSVDVPVPAQYGLSIWNNITSKYDENTYETQNPDQIKEYVQNNFSAGAGGLRVAQFVFTINLTSTQIATLVASYAAGGIIAAGVLTWYYTSVKTLADIINPNISGWLTSPEWTNTDGSSKVNIYISDYFSTDTVRIALQLNGLAAADDPEYYDNNTFTLGTVKTLSRPFYCETDGYLYFQADGQGNEKNKLYKIKADGTNLTWLNVWTEYAPIVYQGLVYFQNARNQSVNPGTLAVIPTSGQGSSFIGQGYGINCTPVISGSFIYFHDATKIYSFGLYPNAVLKLIYDASPYGGLPDNSPVAVLARGYTQDTTCICFQRGDGQLWRVSLDGSNPTSLNNTTLNAPAVTTIYDPMGNPVDYVYFRDNEDHLLRTPIYNPAAGTAVTVGTTDMPVIMGQYVYFRDNDQNRVGKVTLDGSSYVSPLHDGDNTLSAPVPYGDYIYFQDESNNLKRMRVQGTDTFSYRSQANSYPVVANGYVYYQDTNNNLVKVPQNGSSVSPTVLYGSISSPPLVAGGWIYFRGDSDRFLKISINGGTATPVSTTNDLRIGDTPFLGSDNFLYFQETNKRLSKINVDGSGYLFLNVTTECAPCMYNGVVYFRNDSRARVNPNVLAAIPTNGQGSYFPGVGYGITCSPVAANNFIYWHDSQTMYSFNLTNQLLQVLYSAPSGGALPGMAPPFLFENHLYFQGDNNRFLKTKIDGSITYWVGDYLLSSRPFVMDALGNMCFAKDNNNLIGTVTLLPCVQIIATNNNAHIMGISSVNSAGYQRYALLGSEPPPAPPINNSNSSTVEEEAEPARLEC
jgi:hypothetical protein